MRLLITAVLIFSCIFCLPAAAADRPPADIVITQDEISQAGDGGQDGDFFTMGSQQEDVLRIQGQPDNKFFDGRYFIWYYGKDDVYFNYYGEVVGVDNMSGDLKFR